MKAFVSYAWEGTAHKDWVLALATRLRGDGVDVTLDHWHLAPGDQLTDFMERSVRENDFVIVVCTPKYKDRSDRREGGVGYEGDIMTAEVLTAKNDRKFVPVLCSGKWTDAAPSWLVGKLHIDLSVDSKLRENYSDLLDTLLGRRPSAPPLGTVQPSQAKAQTDTSGPGDQKQKLYTRFITSALRTFRLCRDRQRQMARRDRRVLSAMSLPITDEIKAAQLDLQEMFEEISLQGSKATCEAAQGILKTILMANAWSMTATEDGKRNVEAEHKKLLEFRDQFWVSARSELGLDHFSILNKNSDENSPESQNRNG